MTQPTPELSPELNVFVVTPPPDSRLEQLHAVYSARKSAAEAASQQLKDVTDAIKAELTSAAPGQERITLAGRHGPALNLTYVESWRIDSTRLKTEQPETYVRFAKKSSSWRLEVSRGES